MTVSSDSPTGAASSGAHRRFAPGEQAAKGFIVLGLLFFLVVIWGGLAQISGAVIAPGRVVVETSLKRIQHREGGIVREILVHEGDRVEAGQVLVRLDATLANANESVLQGQIWQLSARRMRLEAERDHKGLGAIVVGDDALVEYRAIVEGERKLMASRLELVSRRKRQLNEQISQSDHEIEGLQAQVMSQARQADLIRKELAGVQSLYEKGYATMTRVSELQREVERLDGERGQLVASIARARAQASQIRVAMLQIDSETLSGVMNDLKDTETKLDQLRQQEVTTQDALQRIEIKAPVTGKIQQLAVHTGGGVVNPGETLMLVVPEADNLIVEARVDPAKVDDVRIGSRAFVRFTALDARTTPEAIGRVDRLSSDVESDERSGVSYYRARLLMDSMHMPGDVRKRVVAGMPVEVQIETGRRNALSYFLKPLTDQVSRTFKEK